MFEITIHCDSADFLKITLLGRSHPGADDYWDGNWVKSTIEVQVGGFRGSVVADLRTDELARFLDQLRPLQSSLRGTAEFESMERWLSIRGTGDGRGHMEFRCVVQDQPGVGNKLDFTLATDQSFCQTTVKELAAALQAFPVIGSP